MARRGEGRKRHAIEFQMTARMCALMCRQGLRTVPSLRARAWIMSGAVAVQCVSPAPKVALQKLHSRGSKTCEECSCAVQCKVN